jgi:hypothetical protein
MPKAEGPEEDRDEKLNPAMERQYAERRRRQMGRRRIDEDTDQNVDCDQKPICAEKGLYKSHLSSPLRGRWNPFLCNRDIT